LTGLEVDFFFFADTNPFYQHITLHATLHKLRNYFCTYVTIYVFNVTVLLVLPFP